MASNLTLRTYINAQERLHQGWSGDDSVSDGARLAAGVPGVLRIDIVWRQGDYVVDQRGATLTSNACPG
jgi:hypothetical protein